MTDELKEYEETIKVKHRFWNPKYKEETFVTLEKKNFIPVAKRTFENLGWVIVFADSDEGIIEAKRYDDHDLFTEKITVTYNYRKIKVESVTIGSEIWDKGNNSKRVKLFIHAFNEVLNELDKETLNELTDEFEKQQNWDDYVIPESLPQPTHFRKPDIRIPLIGGIVSAFLIGYAIAFLTHRAAYIFGLFELGVGYSLGFILLRLLKRGNYTNVSRYISILTVSLIIVYVSSNIFLYQMRSIHFHIGPYTFIDFLQSRFSLGLMAGDWILIFLVCLLLQVLFSGLIAYLYTLHPIMKYMQEKVPEEVIDFAYYHFIKGKSEEEVRSELSKMGWTETQNQDDVFDAIGSIQSSTEMART